MRENFSRCSYDNPIYCRYSSNDYYLKELIEEWCEGVLINNNQNEGPLNLNSHDKTDGSKPYSLLLEKVATHLQRDVGDNQAIDIRGLTKVLLIIVCKLLG